MIVPPTLKDLHDAIMTNSAEVVESYLKQQQQGVTFNNANHADMLPSCRHVVDGYGNVAPNCTVATNAHVENSISALHLAVLNCFHNHSMAHHTINQDSLLILHALLQSGANVSLTTHGVYVGLVDALSGKKSLVVVENGTTPLQMAVFFKKHITADGQENMMRQVTAALLQATNKTEQGPLKIRASTVPASVFGAWKKMLLTAQFSDVTFLCTRDGKTFHSHKCILAASSDYFATYFSGPWALHHPDGVYKTNNSSQVMWAVLQFMYTGELSQPTVDAHNQELQCVAHEWQLPELFRISQASCIRNLSPVNVKPLLQLALLHQSKELEAACFSFVKANAAQALTQPEVIALATEDPGLWNKLTRAVSPDSKQN